MSFVLLCSRLQLVLLILSSVPLFSSCLISFHVCWFWCRVFSVQRRSPVSKSPFPFVCLSGVFVLCPVSSWFPLCHLSCVFSLAVMLYVFLSYVRAPSTFSMSLMLCQARVSLCFLLYDSVESFVMLSVLSCCLLCHGLVLSFPCVLCFSFVLVFPV